MHSLTVKLTLAFLLVGIMGAVLVAVLVGYQTRAEFDRFRFESDRADLITALGERYAAQGGWGNIGELFAARPDLLGASRGAAIADVGGVVQFPNRTLPVGQQVGQSALAAGQPITAGGEIVGFLLFDQRDPSPGDRPPPDVQFLQRVTWAAATSAGIAAASALLLGILLARTLTRPIRELTQATQALASGTLSQRVAVRSRDEIGELGRSFNQMSADLEHASQLRKQMTADLAHDLRTPLSILRGYTEGLQDDRLRGSPQLYAIMHGEVEHLQRLVEDLRVLSLADAGELPLNRRSVDPTALLERAALAHMVVAEDQGVALRIEAPESLPSVQVDTDRMAQVLNNLIANALRHTQAGAVTIGAAAVAGGIELIISDTGSGIAPEDLPLIFERFYRADKARQRADSTSSGLGLAITRAIVEAHGGAIRVASELGRGTTFTITLPA